ncbi:MAG: hypothetical protein Q4D51_10935 [Eubacteriales bacterium]|nr:hypothetical protein [Eubacteriales bacterium]
MKKVFKKLCLGSVCVLMLGACGCRSELAKEIVKDVIEEAEITTTEEVTKKVTEDSNKTEDSNETDDTNEEAEKDTTEESKEDDNLVDGMHPEFKEAMDSYEKFFDEYIAFMKKYSSSSDTTSLLIDYANYMTQYADTMKKMDKLGDEEMNEAETMYYFDVTTRINKKLLEVAVQ